MAGENVLPPTGQGTKHTLARRAVQTGSWSIRGVVRWENCDV